MYNNAFKALYVYVYKTPAPSVDKLIVIKCLPSLCRWWVGTTSGSSISYVSSLCRRRRRPYQGNAIGYVGGTGAGAGGSVSIVLDGTHVDVCRGRGGGGGGRVDLLRDELATADGEGRGEGV